MESVGSRFTERYKTAGLDVQGVRVRQARRRSLSQKENRERVVRQSRRLPPGPGLPEEGEGEEESADAPSQAPVDARLERLLRYKEDKLLRKLRAQRQNPKPVFKAGVYRPDAAQYLGLRAADANAEPPKPKTFLLSSSLRVTRSMSKKLESVRPNDTRHVVSTKTCPVTAHVKSNRGGYQPQRQLPAAAATTTAAAAAKERKAPLKPPQARGQSDHRSALKLAEPVPAASGKPSQTRGRAGSKPGATAAVSAQVSKPPTSVAKSLKPGRNEDKQDRKQAAAFAPEAVPPAQPEPGVPGEPSAAEETAGGAEETPSQAVPAAGEADTKVSFAPENCTFRPIAGLAPFTFTPLSCVSAARFLGTCSWSPIGHQPGNGAGDTKGDEAAAIVGDVDVPVCKPPESPAPSLGLGLAGSVHDVPYFRGVMCSETEKLTDWCQQWESWAELPEVPDSGKDLIRTTVGQARLLIAQRFKQFEGLVDDCELGRGEKAVTCPDLDGFWDMVYYQVEDVSKKFELLRTLQGNGWLEQSEGPVLAKRVIKKKLAVSKPPRDKPTKGEQTARTRCLAEVKAAMRARLQLGEDGPGEWGKAGEAVVVFDAGFFKVESPARVFTGTPEAPGPLCGPLNARPSVHSAAAVDCVSPFASGLRRSERPKLPLHTQDLMSFSPSLSPE